MQAPCPITFVKAEDGTPDLTTLAGRVKWARTQRKLSQQALAKKAHVSQGTIGNIESGERKRPRDLLAIARALYANPEWLETGHGEWDQAKGKGRSTAKGEVFDAPDDAEKEMLGYWRRMSKSDRQQMLEEMVGKAERFQADMQQQLDELGVKLPFPLTSPVSADAARRKPVARTEATPTGQRELPLHTSDKR
jgi:transcriptional regulator with XRE-family HTH domain